jgi:hypothetical protein
LPLPSTRRGLSSISAGTYIEPNVAERDNNRAAQPRGASK